MREEVLKVVRMGRLPALNHTHDDPANDELLEFWIDLFAERIQAIGRPVTEEEAAALTQVFGVDDCGGVAWTLLHLIETSPSCEYLKDLEDPPDSELKWIQTLKDSARRSGKFECL